MKNSKVYSIGRKVTFQLAVIASLGFVAMSCEKEEIDSMDPMAASETAIMDLLNGKGAPAKTNTSVAGIAIDQGFSELVAALSYVDQELNTGLVTLFAEGKDQYTVFAPTNEAFMGLYEALEIDAISDLPAELVRDVLLYHVTEGRRASKSVVPPKNMRKVETLLGKSFMVSSEGMIYAIGNTASITAADFSAKNGIVHVIDNVILPIPGSSESETESSLMKKAPKKGTASIAELAIGAGFSELVEALAYVDSELDAGLVDLFSYGTDQYTVFAPTNDAFYALYDALEIEDITDLEPEVVLDVLFYHVTEGRRAANSVLPKKKDRKIETLLGESFLVSPMAMITAIGNTANIAAADISANNGIIHVIDAVILPIN